MDPNQNQPTQPNPAGPLPPTPQPTPSPSPDQPGQPQQTGTGPVVGGVADPGQAQTPAPMPAQPTAGPVSGPQLTDPSTPGAPQPVSFNESKKSRLPIRLIIALVILLLTFGGGFVLLKDTLFSGTSLKSSDLVEETKDSITFKRPKQWTQPSGSISPYDTVFTEDGKTMDEADQAVAVMSESLPLDYSELSAEQRDTALQQIESSFSDPSTFEGENCKEISGLEAKRVPLAGYTDALQVQMTCEQIAGRNVKGKLKASVGISGRDMHMVVVIVLEDTWNKSSDVIDEILTSFKPAS